MNKTNILIGFFIGILTSLIGSFLYITLFTDFEIPSGIQKIIQFGYISKIITLGTSLNLVVFSVLLKKDKELLAWGVLLAVIALAILTLLI